MLKDDEILSRLERLLTAAKTLTAVTNWMPSGRDIALVSSVDVDGVTQEGMTFRATALKEFPDRNVVVQLEFHPSSGRGGAFVRMEWRPLRLHNNKGLGPAEYRYRLVKGSQLHSFELNRALGFSEMVRGNLPIAVPLEPEPSDFRAFINVAREQLRIVDLDRVPLPPWQPDLL